MPVPERYEFFVDPGRCIGCQACVQACTRVRHAQGAVDDPARLRGPRGSTQTVPVVCMHCDSPTCAEVCPADAIKRTEDGVVQTARKPRCIACNNCVLACPFGVPKMTLGHGPDDEVRHVLRPHLGRAQADVRVGLPEPGAGLRHARGDGAAAAQRDAGQHVPASARRRSAPRSTSWCPRDAPVESIDVTAPCTSRRSGTTCSTTSSTRSRRTAAHELTSRAGRCRAARFHDGDARTAGRRTSSRSGAATSRSTPGRTTTSRGASSSSSWCSRAAPSSSGSAGSLLKSAFERGRASASAAADRARRRAGRSAARRRSSTRPAARRACSCGPARRRFVAYDQQCTHLLCPVVPASRAAGCTARATTGGSIWRPAARGGPAAAAAAARDARSPRRHDLRHGRGGDDRMRRRSGSTARSA